MAITKDIVADYGCPTNGTSDCRAAFLAFRAEAQGETATLNIPAGSYNFTFNSGSNDGYLLFKGIPDLTVNMTGATFLDDGGTSGAGYSIGSGSMTGTAGNFARVDSVNPGARSVKCKTVGDATNFTVGEKLLLSGLDLQGLWTSSYGFPPNHHFFEWLEVESVNGTTGIVTFFDPVLGTYLDTWPHYGPGEFPDQGGPATIYKMGDGWDCSLKFNGGSITGTTTGVNCAGREVIFTDHIQAGFGINPSQNQTMRFIDSTLGFVEVDKLIGTLSYEGNTTTGQVHIQSSSVDLLHITGETYVSFLNGTPKRLIADPGTTIDALRVYCTYGRTDEIYCDGVTINSINMPGGSLYKGPSDVGINIAYPMSNGVITIPNTDNAQNWVVPGSYCYWSASSDTETSFQILGVTQDATNIYVQTSMTGGFPSVPLTGGKLYLTVHPAPRATFINCTGCAEVEDWSQFGTVPFASCSRRTYNKTTLTGAASLNYVAGNIRSIKFDVTQAFAGTQDPLTLHGGGQFDNMAAIGPPPTYTVDSYAPLINMRVPGTRTITRAGVTGQQSGDSNLSLPNSTNWLTGGSASWLSHNVSADPSNFSVTVEIITDQWTVGGRLVLQRRR